MFDGLKRARQRAAQKVGRATRSGALAHALTCCCRHRLAYVVVAVVVFALLACRCAPGWARGASGRSGTSRRRLWPSWRSTTRALSNTCAPSSPSAWLGRRCCCCCCCERSLTSRCRGHVRLQDHRRNALHGGHEREGSDGDAPAGGDRRARAPRRGRHPGVRQGAMPGGQREGMQRPPPSFAHAPLRQQLACAKRVQQRLPAPLRLRAPLARVADAGDGALQRMEHTPGGAQEDDRARALHAPRLVRARRARSSFRAPRDLGRSAAQADALT
eukprot:scaffold618_cov372-Prasinococcus_capsulatus_cf.AAC.13